MITRKEIFTKINFMKFGSLFITWLFFPLSMPLLALLTTLYLPTEIDFNTINESHYYLNNTAKKLLFNAFALFIWVFPILSMLLIRITSSTSSYEKLLHVQQRKTCILTSIYALMLSLVLFRFNQQIELSIHYFSLTYTICLLSLFFAFLPRTINISIYACGIGVFLGFLFAYYSNQSLLTFWPLYLYCCIMGVALSLYLYLNKNTLWATMWGASIGFIITFVINSLFIFYN